MLRGEVEKIARADWMYPNTRGCCFRGTSVLVEKTVLLRTYFKRKGDGIGTFANKLEALFIGEEKEDMSNSFSESLQNSWCKCRPLRGRDMGFPVRLFQMGGQARVP